MAAPAERERLEEEEGLIAEEKAELEAFEHALLEDDARNAACGFDDTQRHGRAVRLGPCIWIDAQRATRSAARAASDCVQATQTLAPTRGEALTLMGLVALHCCAAGVRAGGEQTVEG